jgi:hypothetical protein
LVVKDAEQPIVKQVNAAVIKNRANELKNDKIQHVTCGTI